MNKIKTERIAQILREAQESGVPCPPIRELMVEAAEGDDSIATAYAVQAINSQRLLDQGRRLVGRKIGLTSLAVQKQLGVDSPDFGMLFDFMAVGDGEEITLKRTLQPKVEAEIALILGRDLTREKHTFADLIGATEYALPAIEVVGSRIANWDIRLTDTVADNASSGLFVLGSTPKRLDMFDLSGCKMKMELAGSIVSSGTGAACLGNPLNAAAWLADKMVELGAPLKAGDILMTGALGPMVPVEAGNRFVAEIEGLGKVSAIFGA